MLNFSRCTNCDSSLKNLNVCIRHAGIWTVEEATRMCRDKMIRLRSLYITQFKRLQHVLRERRRKYCQAIQAEEIEEMGKHLHNARLFTLE